MEAAFTYQRRWDSDGQPLNISADYQFALCDAVKRGNTIGAKQAKKNSRMTEDLFTSLLDIGTAPNTTNQARWHQIVERDLDRK